jgi:hypothetical protein
MQALFTVLSASDMKFGFTGPAAPTLLALVVNRTVTVGDASTVTTTVRTTYDTTGISGTLVAGSVAAIVDIRGIIQNGANAGPFQFTWAQNSAVAENTICERGSWLHYSVV